MLLLERISPLPGPAVAVMPPRTKMENAAHLSPNSVSLSSESQDSNRLQLAVKLPWAILYESCRTTRSFSRYVQSRTDKPFSRIPIDLTFVQTINAEASRRLSGIAHFTNSLAARQCWTINHSIRASCYNLSRSRYKYSLYNIATAKPVPENVANFLLNIEKNGEDLRKQFITECAEDQDRFYKPIKKIKCLILLVLQRRKVTLSNTVIELRMQRDLFGRLLGISMTNKVDIEKISVDAQVVVHCSDSDALIILLGNLDHLNASVMYLPLGVHPSKQR
ncbi:uncharacterized protein TNCV_2012251 [Trichonephila clavipes]|nr:uncharacterized protein TNCV_2012251 [Trichonephila clavipes]